MSAGKLWVPKTLEVFGALLSRQSSSVNYIRLCLILFKKVAMNLKNRNNLYFLYCKHFDIQCMNGDITFHLCSALSKGVRWQVVGTQNIRGVWCIAVRSGAALATLLDSGITVNDTHIKLYSGNP